MILLECIHNYGRTKFPCPKKGEIVTLEKDFKNGLISLMEYNPKKWSFSKRFYIEKDVPPSLESEIKEALQAPVKEIINV